jgi:8-oxo-dGTP pyrophosphatase MutT (NUDIX family)
MKDNYCNNCGKIGHLYHQCKMPITSIGIILFRYKDEVVPPPPGIECGEIVNTKKIEYLMIRRKDTLGFIDFMRGKYSIFNKDYIMNMLKQMSVAEKNNLKTLEFSELWKNIWGNENISNQYKVEEIVSREKFNSLRNGVLNKNLYYTLSTLIDESYQYDIWDEPEWGFPKGRRNYQEKDYECAIREFSEETGLNVRNMKILQNISPFEEIFTGSNYKSYKHKYFIAHMPYHDTHLIQNYEESEVSKIEWKTYEECMNSIRTYNLEKKRLITNIDYALTNYKIFI